MLYFAMCGYLAYADFTSAVQPGGLTLLDLRKVGKYILMSDYYQRFLSLIAYLSFNESFIRFRNLPLYFLSFHPNIPRTMADGNMMHWGTAILYPLTYQSQEIAFEDWISLFTLCLAPLIAHVAAGTPQPSYISRDRPRWHDRLCHFNPTSILFRYAAIADRRIRALRWDASTMAASNALFWTDNGWDGSEEMIFRSLPYCTHLPEHSRVEFISWEMGKTIITTIQGVEPLHCLINILIGSTDVNIHMAVGDIFPVLALLGLLRLCAALWLTGDFVYTTSHSSQRSRMSLSRALTITVEENVGRKASFDSLLQSGFAMTVPAETQFRPLSYWPSRLFRTMYFLAIVALAALCARFLVPWSKQESMYTTTSILVGILDITFLSMSIFLYGYYSVRGTTSTIIPCISSIWYKIYTLLIMTFIGALIIIAAIETRKTPCGKFTSLPGETGDIATCVTNYLQLYPVHPGSEISLQNFTGSCIGSFLGSHL
ncbi:hypothetical protein F4776DRAFT_638330 [Hypoxylon sp. NC0597]|nr:hypothetical protein F4776DRAFT_638330 [Hypoxylon sp. NC0597]